MRNVIEGFQRFAEKFVENVNIIPLCLSCVYFTVIAVSTMMSIFRSQENDGKSSASAAVVLTGIIAASYILGMWTVFPSTTPTRNRGRKKRRRNATRVTKIRKTTRVVNGMKGASDETITEDA